MKRICAWCGEYLGEVSGPADMITHGMCRKCQDEFTAGIEEQKKLSLSDELTNMYEVLGYDV